MSGALVVVSGTATGIGKTHVCEALLHALASLGRRAAGLKPIESGVASNLSDAARLARASTFHVKHFGHSFPEGLSPHLASRRAGEPILVDAVAASVRAVRVEGDVVVELPGGLFSPLTDRLVNADLARELQPDHMVLVAPDRLGVLHDVIAAQRAALSVPIRLDGLAIVAPPLADASTGTNAAELRRVQALPVLVEVPWAPPEALAAMPPMLRLARRIAGIGAAGQ